MKNLWTRDQLLVAFYLYFKLPFGQLDRNNSEVKRFSQLINRTPSALAMKLTNIASLDPAIRNAGKSGLKGASITDRNMWAEMQGNWDAFFSEVKEQVERILQPAERREELGVPDDANLQTDFIGTNKEALVKIRVNQNLFRRAVLSAYGFRCCITGLSIRELLVASHIVPWSQDPHNRLNPGNGLCLSPLYDKAFDRGIICIESDFTIRVSQKYLGINDPVFQKCIGELNRKQILLPSKFAPNEELLSYHRSEIFQP